jgi:hypothetical protein
VLSLSCSRISLLEWNDSDKSHIIIIIIIIIAQYLESKMLYFFFEWWFLYVTYTTDCPLGVPRSRVRSTPPIKSGLPRHYRTGISPSVINLVTRAHTSCLSFQNQIPNEDNTAGNQILLRSALFSGITQRWIVILYRRFGQLTDPIFKG